MFRQAAESIRDSDKKPWIFVVSTGGGVRVPAYLWDLPGISSCLAGSAFTYSCHETDKFLQFKPDKYCSEDTAINMAMTAYMRACESLPHGRIPVGLAVTANVASHKEHRGDHRIHAAIITPEVQLRTHVVLNKGLGHDIRGRDGKICDTVGFNLMLRALDKDTLPIHVIGSDDEGWENYNIIQTFEQITDVKLRELFFKYPVLSKLDRTSTEIAVRSNTVFFPGTFNPLHDGHRYMAKVAEDLSNVQVMYMLTADSPHKTPLTVPALLMRAVSVSQDHECREVIVTQNDPLFIDKARAYPGAGFLIGSDSMERLLDPRWYGGKTEAVIDMLSEFERLGTRFYVFGRDSGSGMVRMSDIPVIGHFRSLFVQMPDNKYAISSSQIRAKQAVDK